MSREVTIIGTRATLGTTVVPLRAGHVHRSAAPGGRAMTAVVVRAVAWAELQHP